MRMSAQGHGAVYDLARFALWRAADQRAFAEPDYGGLQRARPGPPPAAAAAGQRLARNRRGSPPTGALRQVAGLKERGQSA